MVNEDLMDKVRELVVKRDMDDERVRIRLNELKREWLGKRYEEEKFEVRMNKKYGKVVEEFVKKVNEVVEVKEVKKRIDRDEFVKMMEYKVGMGLMVIGNIDNLEERKKWIDEERKLNVLRLKMMKKMGIGYERGLFVRNLMMEVE